MLNFHLKPSLPQPHPISLKILNFFVNPREINVIPCPAQHSLKNKKLCSFVRFPDPYLLQQTYDRYN